MSDDKRHDSARRTADSLRATAVLSSAGLTLAAAIALGALGGNWLDQKLGTAPWLLILGFVVGSVAGFMQMLQMIRMAGKR